MDTPDSALLFHLRYNDCPWTYPASAADCTSTIATTSLLTLQPWRSLNIPLVLPLPRPQPPPHREANIFWLGLYLFILPIKTQEPDTGWKPAREAKKAAGDLPPLPLSQKEESFQLNLKQTSPTDVSPFYYLPPHPPDFLSLSMVTSSQLIACSAF